MAARQGRRRRRTSSTPTLRSLAEGLRVRDRAAARRTCPESAEKLLDALGAAETRARRRARFGAAPGRAAGRRSSPPLFPKPRVIDSHTHLDRAPGAGGRARRRGRARRACTRILTIGTDADVAAAPRSRAAEAYAEVVRRDRPPPQRARPASTTPITDELRELAAPPALPRDRRDRPRRLPRLRAARRPGARVRRPDRSSRASSASRSSSTRARPRTTRSRRSPREAEGLEVILHCFSMPDRLDECLDHGWWISFAGNVTYPKAHGPRRGGRARPARPPAGGDRRAVPDAAGACARSATSRPTSSTPRASSPSGAGSPTRSSRRRSSANAAELFGW